MKNEASEDACTHTSFLFLVCTEYGPKMAPYFLETFRIKCKRHNTFSVLHFLCAFLKMKI